MKMVNLIFLNNVLNIGLKYFKPLEMHGISTYVKLSLNLFFHTFLNTE